MSHGSPCLYELIPTNLFLYAQGWLLRSGINKALWILHTGRTWKCWSVSRGGFGGQGAAEGAGGVGLEKMRIRRDLLTPHKSLAGGWSRVGLGSAPRE